MNVAATHVRCNNDFTCGEGWNVGRLEQAKERVMERRSIAPSIDYRIFCLQAVFQLERLTSASREIDES